MFAISNEELKNALSLDKTYACPRCDRMHEVMDSDPPGLLQTVRCGKSTYLVGIKWMALPPPKVK